MEKFKLFLSFLHSGNEEFGGANAIDNTINTLLILAAKNGNSRKGIRIHPTDILKQIYFSFR